MDGINSSIIAGSFMNINQPAPTNQKEKKKSGDDIRKVNKRSENKF